MTVTKKGLVLADKLGRYVGWAPGISETCSLICRHATTYDRIQVMWCNDEMSDARTARVEKREAQIEERIRHLVAMLPETDDGPFRVQFDGDPRGYTTRLLTPDGREIGVA